MAIRWVSALQRLKPHVLQFMARQVLTCAMAGGEVEQAKDVPLSRTHFGSTPQGPHRARVLLLSSTCPKGFKIVNGLYFLIDGGQPESVEVRGVGWAGAGGAGGGIGECG